MRFDFPISGVRVVVLGSRTGQSWSSASVELWGERVCQWHCNGMAGDTAGVIDCIYIQSLHVRKRDCSSEFTTRHWKIVGACISCFVGSGSGIFVHVRERGFQFNKLCQIMCLNTCIPYCRSTSRS